MALAVRDVVRRTEAFCRAGARSHGFDCAIAWRRVGHKRIEQVLRGMGDLIHSTIESSFVYFRRSCETAEFAHELQ